MSGTFNPQPNPRAEYMVEPEAGQEAEQPAGPDIRGTLRLPADDRRMVVLEPHRIYLERTGTDEDYNVDVWSLLGGVFRLRSVVLKAKDEVAYLWDELEFGKGSVRHPKAMGLCAGLCLVWFFAGIWLFSNTTAGTYIVLGGTLGVGLILPFLIRKQALVITGPFTRIRIPWSPKESGFERFANALRDRVLYWRAAAFKERLAASERCLVNWDKTDPQRGILSLWHRSSAHELPPVCVCTGEPAETLFPSLQASGTDIGFFGFSKVFRLYLPMRRRSALAARMHQRVYGITSAMGPLIFTLGFAALAHLPGAEEWAFWSWPNMVFLALFSLVWARVWSGWRRVLPVYVVKGGLRDSSLTLGFANRQALEKVLEVCASSTVKEGEELPPDHGGGTDDGGTEGRLQHESTAPG